MRPLASTFLAGVVFAWGLGISGMTNPEKIIGFLDVAGSWDPSLALVMVGAIAAHVGVARWGRPIRGAIDPAAAPPRGPIDAPLVTGAALFGLGWGIAGFCPGPALVDLVAPSASLLIFVAAMVVGIAVFRLGEVRRPSKDAPSFATGRIHANPQNPTENPR